MRQHLSRPRPFTLLILINNPHPLPNLALHRPNTTALLPFAFNIILANHVRLPLHPPLRLRLLHPPHSFHWTPTTSPHLLLLALRMSLAAFKQLLYLLHPHVCGDGR